MTYPGGKAGAGVYQAIINQIPPHRVYVEPFAGGAAILRHKRPAACSIAIDRDAGIGASIAASGVPGVTFIEGCGVDFLERHDWRGDEFVYCDPPYLPEARYSSRRLYAFEMTRELHTRLLAVLQALPCPAAVSGYYSELYARELAGWRVVTFNARTRGRTCTEYLWCNYQAPAALHDYRYLGRTYRERERIKRKAARWRANLDAMPELERQALLSVIAADAPTSPPPLLTMGPGRGHRQEWREDPASSAPTCAAKHQVDLEEWLAEGRQL